MLKPRGADPVTEVPPAPSPKTAYRAWGKRAFDLALTVSTVVIWGPILAVVALVVRSKLGSPVFFRQQRPGHHGRPFTILKFRTMSDARNADGSLRPDSDRLNRFGSALRSTSLDELPEILNVLKGEMSLVGPRPLLMRYLGLYSPEQMRRHDVPPGITGWAQVKGRNALSWDEKFAMDVWYVENQHLALDVRILASTLWKVARREGISAEGCATMPEFEGTRE
jgi:lipopolysaccharide/colanic/teichoic acid biosynthesis glycosyltransferase